MFYGKTRKKNSLSDLDKMFYNAVVRFVIFNCHHTCFDTLDMLMLIFFLTFNM